MSLRTLPGCYRKFSAGGLLTICLGSLAVLSLAQELPEKTAGQTMTAEDKSTLQSAVRDYENGNSQTAEPVLQTILRRYPHNAEAMESLGLIYAERNQIQKALPLLESARGAAPSSPTVFENLGITYLKLGRNADAVRAFRQAAVLEPDARHEEMLGTALMRLTRYEEAAQAFQQASQSDPANRESRYQWALALFLSGDLGHAAQHLQSAAASDRSAPENALLGDIHEREGRFAEAVDDYRSAARLNPSLENVNALGLEFLRHSAFDAAVPVYSDGLSRYPSSPRMMLGMAMSKYGTNDFTGAAALFSILLRYDPHSKVYLQMLARSCDLNMSDPGTACDGIIIYAEAHPNDVTAETSAAATILQRNRDQQDLTLVHTFLQRALAANPRSVEANYLMGIWYQQQSSWQDSLPFLRKALQIDPGYGRAHYRLARALFRLGDRADGEREIERNAQCNRVEQQKTDQALKAMQPFLAAMR